MCKPLISNFIIKYKDKDWSYCRNEKRKTHDKSKKNICFKLCHSDVIAMSSSGKYDMYIMSRVSYCDMKMNI